MTVALETVTEQFLSKVRKDWRVTVPLEVRRILALETGDIVRVTLEVWKKE